MWRIKLAAASRVPLSEDPGESRNYSDLLLRDSRRSSVSKGPGSAELGELVLSDRRIDDGDAPQSARPSPQALKGVAVVGPEKARLNELAMR